MSIKCDDVIEYVEKYLLVKLTDEQKIYLREAVRSSAVNFVMNMHMSRHQSVLFPERE